MVSFSLNLIIHKHNVLEYTNKKNESKGEGGIKQMLTGLTKGGAGLGKCLQWLTKGVGGRGNADNG